MSTRNIMGPTNRAGLPQKRHAPLLSIKTLHPDRDWVEIDDEVYWVRMPSELSVMEYTRIQSAIARVQDLAFSEETAADDLKLVNKLLNDAVLVIVPSLPEKVIELMSGDDKKDLLTAFIGSLPQKNSPTTAMTTSPEESRPSPPMKPTGGKSSRNSRRTMAQPIPGSG